MAHLIKMFSVLVMVFLLSSVVHAQFSEKETLRGLKGVNVEVEDLNPDIEKDGLYKSSIQTDVELKLRMAGIKVLTKEESFKEPGMPYLYIKVGSIKDEWGIYAFTINVEFIQVVFLSRDIKILLPATTWHSIGWIGTVDSRKVNDIRDYVKDRIDEFINDYLSVNPKE